MVAAPLVIEAHAKLNLTLRVLGRRADGYHQLHSLVVFLALADRLEIAPHNTLCLTLDGDDAKAAGQGEENLVIKAARALAAHAGVVPAATIHLRKAIPIGGGLGGGSADAAAALHGLNALWCLNLSADELAAIARPLGADVPACVYGAPLWMSEVGHSIAPVGKPAPSWPVLLVNPRVHLSTADVYAALAAPVLDEAMPLPNMPVNPFDVAWLCAQGNDLEAAAKAWCPPVADVLAWLSAQRGARVARLCGSGATSFALFDHADDCMRAAQAIAKEKPEWWMATTRVL